MIRPLLRIVSVTLALVLALAPLATPEPRYTEISATQVVQSKTLPTNTLSVVVINDGPNTAYFRLFTDCDTAGNASTNAVTVNSIPISADEVLPLQLMVGRGSEAYGSSCRAKYYKSISVICAAGQTAGLRVISM